MTTGLLIKIAIGFFGLIAILDLLIFFSAFSLHKDWDAWEEQELLKLIHEDSEKKESTPPNNMQHYKPWHYTRNKTE